MRKKNLISGSAFYFFISWTKNKKGNSQCIRGVSFAGGAMAARTERRRNGVECFGLLGAQAERLFSPPLCFLALFLLFGVLFSPFSPLWLSKRGGDILGELSQSRFFYYERFNRLSTVLI
jgi:hypothetical protein